MRKDAQDQVAMLSRLVAFLTAHAADLAASPAATAQAAGITTGYPQLASTQGLTARRTQALTEGGKQAKATLLDLLPALLGPLSRVAACLPDADLLASATLSGKQLRKLRPQALLTVAEAVLDSTTRPAVATELAQQGLTAAALQPLRTALATFRTAQPAPRQTIDQRTLANATANAQLDALMDEVRELDQDMKAFKLLNPALHDAYLQARKIINSGGGSGKPDAAPAGV